MHAQAEDTKEEVSEGGLSKAGKGEILNAGEGEILKPVKMLQPKQWPPHPHSWE
jgi:hypothetical protein